MKNITLYRRYLAADRASKRVEALGAKTGLVFFSEDATFWRKREAESIKSGETPNLYRYPEIRIDLDTDSFFGTDDWDLSLEEREKVQQERREALIRNAMATYDDFIVARFDGTAYLYFEALEGVSVSINVGQALCKRVLISEKIVDVPDPELLAAAVASVPKVQKVEATYGFKCNDAEFGASA